jgi:hypothetical protein
MLRAPRIYTTLRDIIACQITPKPASASLDSLYKAKSLTNNESPFPQLLNYWVAYLESLVRGTPFGYAEMGRSQPEERILAGAAPPSRRHSEPCRLDRDWEQLRIRMKRRVVFVVGPGWAREDSPDIP